MKYSKIALACLFFTCNSFAADNTQFQYIEITKILVSLDDYSDDMDGFGIEGKLALGDYSYINAAYQTYEDDFNHHERFMLGAGVKYEVNEYLIPFSQLDYMKLNAEAKGWEWKWDGKQYRLGAGVAGSYANVHYKVGLNRYFSDDSESNDFSVQFVDISYQFSDAFSVVARAEIESNTDMYSLGGRYNF